jgi:hypothetical protein
MKLILKLYSGIIFLWLLFTVYVGVRLKLHSKSLVKKLLTAEDEMTKIQSKFQFSHESLQTRARMFFPRNEKRLAYLIRRAKLEGNHIRVVGSGTSEDSHVVDKVDESSLVVSLSGMRQDVWEVEGDVMKASAGLTIYEVMSRLRPMGLSLESDILDPRVTLGGSVCGWSWGTRHGKGGLHDSIIALRVMDEEGKVHVLGSKEKIRFWLGTFGFRGVVLTVKMRLRGEFGMLQSQVFLVPLKSNFSKRSKAESKVKKVKDLEKDLKKVYNGYDSSIWFFDGGDVMKVFTTTLRNGSGKRVENVGKADKDLFMDGSRISRFYESEKVLGQDPFTISSNVDYAVACQVKSFSTTRDGFSRGMYFAELGIGEGVVDEKVRKKRMWRNISVWGFSRSKSLGVLVHLSEVNKVLDAVRLVSSAYCSFTFYYNNNQEYVDKGLYVLCHVEVPYNKVSENSKKLATTKLGYLDRYLSEIGVPFPGLPYGYDEVEQVPFHKHHDKIFEKLTTTGIPKVFARGSFLRWTFPEQAVPFTNKELVGAMCGGNGDCVSGCCDKNRTLRSNRLCLQSGLQKSKECSLGCQCLSGSCKYHVMWGGHYCV